jgi:hypothetical protein
MTRLGALLICAQLATGCVQFTAPVQPPPGFLFTSIRAPLTVDFDKTPVGTKRGESSVIWARDILFTGQTVAWESAAIEEAAREGGITTVRHADYEALIVLGVFGWFKVIVYGD